MHLDKLLTKMQKKLDRLCIYHWLSLGLTPGTPPENPQEHAGNGTFLKKNCLAGWGHCLVFETSVPDPRDAPPGFDRHWC